MGSRLDTNPLMRLIGRQKLGQEAADEYALVIFLSLDAAKRGKATGRMANNLCMYMLTAIRIWHYTGKSTLYADAVKGWDALTAACKRPTELLDLTTGEYTALRRALGRFIALLPQIELATFTDALARADREMSNVAQPEEQSKEHTK